MISRPWRLALVLQVVVLMAGAPVLASSGSISMVRLTRGTCRAACPDYVLTLRSDDCASLKGNSDFSLIGNYSGFTSSFSDAVEAINSHHFFQMKSAYPVLPNGAKITDAAVATLAVYRSDGPPVTITVTGDRDIPSSVTELLHVIDGIGFSAIWFNDATKAPVASVHLGGTLVIEPAKYKPCS